jgi:hypothetical protein
VSDFEDSQELRNCLARFAFSQLPSHLYPHLFFRRAKAANTASAISADTARESAVDTALETAADIALEAAADIADYKAFVESLTPTFVQNLKRTMDHAIAVSPLFLLRPANAGKSHGPRMDLVTVRQIHQPF